MEICIQAFDGTHDADDALKSVLAAEAEQNPWLHQVAVVRRPVIGKISISATYDDEPSEVKQGDLASDIEEAGAMTGYLIGSLVGPLHAEMTALEASSQARALGGALEDKLLHVDDIKRFLPRGTSALVLVARSDINDRFVDVFDAWSPNVVRRDIAEEIEERLHAFEQRAHAYQQQQASP